MTEYSCLRCLGCSHHPICVACSMQEWKGRVDIHVVWWIHGRCVQEGGWGCVSDWGSTNSSWHINVQFSAQIFHMYINCEYKWYGDGALYDLNESAQVGGTVMAKWVICFGRYAQKKNTGLQGSTLFNHRMTTGSSHPMNWSWKVTCNFITWMKPMSDKVEIWLCLPDQGGTCCLGWAQD